MQHELKISFRDVMASAFRRHARGEAFRALTRQPENPQKAVRQWQMPWMYLRLFGILLLMAAVCLACIWLDIGALPAPYIYAFFWCGALLPLTLAMFLWELDPFVNISIFEMMGLALLSGVVCVLFGTPVDNSIISGYFAPVWGYVKDSVLMLGVLILVLVCTRKRMYGLGGLALGAAIGAGYALFTMLMASIVDTPIVETPTGLARDFSGLTNAISASVPMLFGNHALWFAPVAGALGLRMNGEKINIRHFADVRVILLILLGFAENYLMNSAKSPFGWTFLNADLIALTRTDAIEVKHVIVLAIGMAALIRTIRLCVAQGAHRRQRRGGRAQGAHRSAHRHQRNVCEPRGDAARWAGAARRARNGQAHAHPARRGGQPRALPAHPAGRQHHRARFGLVQRHMAQWQAADERTGYPYQQRRCACHRFAERKV